MTDTPQDVNSGQDDPEPIDPTLADVSPSVRRLLRQYDVDITRIRGTGPNGRIRPNDVLGIVGNPQLTKITAGSRPTMVTASRDIDADADADAAGQAAADAAPATGEAAEPHGTTIFVCNMLQVLNHRKRSGLTDISVACYVAKAAGLASNVFHQLRSREGDLPIAVSLTTADGERHTVLATPGADSVEEIHTALTNSTASGGEPARARLALFHHGMPGNLADFRPPAAKGEAAILGIGGLHRTVGVGAADAGETPRIVVECNLALTYRPSVITSSQAARFLAECVRILETWPVPETV